MFRASWAIDLQSCNQSVLLNVEIATLLFTIHFGFPWRSLFMMFFVSYWCVWSHNLDRCLTSVPDTFTGADGPHPTIQIHGCRHGHDLWQGVSWQRWLPDCRGGQRPATSHPAPGGQVSPTRTEQVHGANCWAVGHLDTGEGTVTVTFFKIKSFLLTCIGLVLYWQIGPSGKFIIAFQAPVQCCFMSTETVRTIRDGEPRTATSAFKQLPSSVL